MATGYGSPNRKRLPGANPAHARQILRKYGYNVRGSGDWTPRLHNAWEHYLKATRTVGGPNSKRAARNWNQTPLGQQLTDQRRGAGGQVSSMHGGAYRGSGGPSKAFVKEHGGYNPGKRPKGNVRAGAVPVAHGHTKAKTRAAVHAQHLGAGKQHRVGGAAIPGVTGAGPAVNKLLPTKYAETLAGAQFDPQIREATLEQLRQRRDQAQAERDINDWAGQVRGSQETARTRDVAAGAAASGDVKNVIQGLIDSLGGSRGAGVVAAAGVNDLTAIDRQGAAQNTFNADLAPILRAEQATNLSRQRALGTQSQDKLSGALIDLQGQRGQAKAKALTDIVQANNAARQQNFGNRLALNNAQLAALSLGMKGQEFQASLRQQGLANRVTNAKLRAEQKANKIASGHPDWAVLNPIDRRKLADQAVADAVGQLPPGVWDEEHILNSAYHNLRAGGYGSARRKGKVPSQRNRTAIIGAVNNALARARQQHRAAPAA